MLHSMRSRSANNKLFGGGEGRYYKQTEAEESPPQMPVTQCNSAPERASPAPRVERVESNHAALASESLKMPPLLQTESCCSYGQAMNLQ